MADAPDDDSNDKRSAKTFQGFAHPGLEEDPGAAPEERDAPKTIPAPFPEDDTLESSDSPIPTTGEHPVPDIPAQKHPSTRPVDEGASDDDSPPSGEMPVPPQATRGPHDDVPLVEIEVVHQHGPAPRMESPAQTLEVWTQNRIYTTDSSLICVRVMDRETQTPDPEHAFLGYKLVGGQHRERDTFELSYPFPRPGTEAVFEHPTSTRGQFSRTSTVHRVVLRLHVITVAPNRLVPTWAGITNHEMALPPGEKKKK